MADYRGQISFDGIAKTYPTQAHVQCAYIMRSTHAYSAYDYIGIFKVGWSNVKEVLYYIWVPSPKDRAEGEECRGSVLFKAGSLPKEDGEFYQFIYINDQGKMCGASSPFQFRAPRTEDDFITEDMKEDEDMVFITTRHLQLEEKLNSLEREQDRLSKTCDTLTEEKTELLEERETLRSQITSLKEEKDGLLRQLQEGKERADTLEQNLDEQSEQSQRAYEELKQEAKNLEEKSETADALLAEKELTLTQLRNELDHCAGQVEALKREKALYQEHSATAEAAKQQALNELASIRGRYEENVTEKEAMETLQMQLQSSQDTIEILERNKRQQKEIIDGQHDKLLATEARHVVDASEICTLSETLSNMSMKIEESQTEVHEIKAKYTKAKKKYQTEKQDWDNTLDTMSKEKNGLLSTICELKQRIANLNKDKLSPSFYAQQEDRYIALQEAFGLLKSELKARDAEVETLQRRASKMKEVNQQACHLQERLRKGEGEMKRRNSQQNQKSPPARTGGAKDELSKQELQTMVEQLSGELEERTQKKDKYKSKYLDEKQRAATLRDYYKGEMEKQQRDLELARAQLDRQVFHRSSSVTPIVYPPVPEHISSDNAERAKNKPSSAARQLSTASEGLAALVQSFTEDNTDKAPLKPLPTPMEPLKITRSDSTSQDKEGGANQNTVGGANNEGDAKNTEDFKKVLMASLNLRTASTEHAIVPAIVYPEISEEALVAMRRPREVLVMSRTEESDEDNDGADRFHDAFDVPTLTMVKCCVCEKVFRSNETEEMRNAHVMEHLENGDDPPLSSINSHFCPICQQPFRKPEMTDEEFNVHVQAHFTITN